MKAYQWLIVAAAVLMAVAGVAIIDNSESTADPEFSEYTIYYMIDDPRLTANQYSIDCSGIYVTNSYVFYKEVPVANGTVGTLPATENIVSRYFGYDLSHDGYVINPTGSAYGYDVSGWFAESTYENRVLPDTTLSSLDTDDDGIVVLHMKAAKVYDVTYHMRNTLNGKRTDFMWYDGYHLERDYPNLYNRNQFSDVDYIVTLTEGQPVPNSLPDTGNMFCPESGNDLIYIPISNWAIVDGAYLMDEYTVSGQQRSWFLMDGNYPDIDTEDCTPVYPGLTVTASLDPNDDGVIELYGTSNRAAAEMTYFLTVTFAQQDTNLRNYGDNGYNGYTEQRVYRVPATQNNSRIVFSGYKLLLPEYDGFDYSSVTRVRNISSASVAYETVDGVPGWYATVNGSVNASSNNYSGNLTIKFARETMNITVVGETLEVHEVAYGTALTLPNEFNSHTIYRWNTTNLHNNITCSGPYYQYVVTLDDLGSANATITAEWQNGIQDRYVYTVEYISRVNGIEIVSSVVDDEGYITLPMIEYPGFAHLGWALVNPDIEIIQDISELVIYPGRTSFYPYSVHEQFKEIDGSNDHMITVKLYAIWCTSYTISFNANTGSGSMPTTNPIHVNESFTLPANRFTKEGATFIGWSLTPNGTVEYTDRASVMGLSIEADGNVTLYAKWSNSGYAFIVYDMNGGSLPDGHYMHAQQVPLTEGYGTQTLTANEFIRKGYTFYGWSLSSGTSKYDAGMSITDSVIYLGGNAIGYADGTTVTISESISLFAIWKPVTYYIAFDGNGGTGSMSTQTFYYGTPQTLSINTFTKNGSVFGGWADINGNTYANGYIIDSLTDIDGTTITFYAIWSNYYIDIHSNDGNNYNEIYAAIPGVPFPLPECDYSYSGHHFVSWNTSADGTGTAYHPGDYVIDLAAPEGTAHLYAIWQYHYYYIEFNSSEGSGSMTGLTAYWNTPIDLTPNAFTKSGYDFTGWAITPGGSVMYADGASVTNLGTGEFGETVTLYAVWERSVVHLTLNNLKSSDETSEDGFDAQAGLGLPSEIKVGDTIILSLVDNSTFRKYISYNIDKKTKSYLYSWTLKDTNGTVRQTLDYGDSLYVTAEMDGWELYASYSASVDTLYYHINIPGQPDTTHVVRIAVTTNGNTVTGSVTVADCPFERDGYTFCIWAGNQNSLGTAYLPDDTYSVSRGKKDSSEHHLYAAWMIVSVDDPQYYTGDALEPVPTIHTYIGTFTGNITSATRTYSDNVNAGIATIHITMPAAYHNLQYDYQFVINKAPVTVEVDDKSKYFGQNDPTLTGTAICTTGASMEGLVITYTRVPGENAGSYTISASFTHDNYVLESQTVGTMTINPAEVTLAVLDSYKYYGAADPEFRCNATCPTAPVGSLEYQFTRTPGENAGDYTITATINNVNYTIVSENTGTLTIRPAKVNITMDNASKIYGEADPIFTGMITCSTASVDVLEITFCRTNAGVEAVGVYNNVITATYTPNANYSVNIITANFTIIEIPYDHVYYIILDGRGGSETYTDHVQVAVGTPFPDKTVSANDGYSFYEWVRVIYNGNTIVSFKHVSYSPTLRSEDITEGTYMAFFVTGDEIRFDSNGGTGSMSSQEFDDCSGTLSTNTFVKEGNVFVGWALSSEGDAVYTDNMPLTRISGLSTNGASNVLYAVWRPCTYTSEIIWTNNGHMLVSNGTYIRMDNSESNAILNGKEKATVSSSWLGILSEEGKGLTVNLDNGSITFDDDCVDTFAAVGKDITFAIRAVAEEGYANFDIKNDGTILAMYNITASYIDNNGNRAFIHALSGNAVVTVNKPEGADSVVYVGDGNQPSNFIAGGDTISFTTDHFSLYGIVDECDSGSFISDVPAEEKEDPLTVLVFGFLACISTITAAILLIQRRGL